MGRETEIKALPIEDSGAQGEKMVRVSEDGFVIRLALHLYGQTISASRAF
ncbi:hypothetical protein [Neisseria sp. P0014.S006]